METLNCGRGARWLTTEELIVPGETIPIEVMLFDVSDAALDSAALLDGQCGRGFVAPRNQIIVVTDAAEAGRVGEVIEGESPVTRIDMRTGFLMATVFVSM